MIKKPKTLRQDLVNLLESEAEALKKHLVDNIEETEVYERNKMCKEQDKVHRRKYFNFMFGTLGGLRRK